MPTVTSARTSHSASGCKDVASCSSSCIGIWLDELWLDRAREFADLAMAYRANLPEGDAWPTDEPGLYSADFMYGASGLGHYFLRLQQPRDVKMPFM